MRRSTLWLRSLAWRWPTHLATALAAAVVSTVITGALLVGDSVKGSLADQALARLGPVQQAVISPRLFPAKLVQSYSPADQVPVLRLPGTARIADGDQPPRPVTLLGVDEHFWAMYQATDPGGTAMTRRLAEQLGIAVGQDLLVSLERPSAVPSEMLLGRRDRRTARLRLTLARILEPQGPGLFSLDPITQPPANLYIPLAELQRAIGRPGQVNAALATTQWLNVLSPVVNASDLGLHLRPGVESLVLTSERLLLDGPTVTAATGWAAEGKVACQPVLTYLANSIAIEHGQARKSVPYSTVAACDPVPGWPASELPLAQGRAAQGDDEIVLNEWTAVELSAAIGDQVTLTFYSVARFARLETQTARFSVVGIARMEGLVVDRAIIPPYEGLTDVRDMRDWAPPFPMDMGAIRPVDEEYWDRYGPAPKAFVTLQAGQRLWSQGQEHFGTLSALRYPAAVDRSGLERALASKLGDGNPNFMFQRVREQALAAADGTTDFAGLFMAFSMFLLASAAMLVALLFRLAVDRRAAEAGTLLAVGWRPGQVRAVLLAEGAVVALVGSLLGMLGAIVYTRLMLTGLSHWWGTAVAAPVMRVHISGITLAAGTLGSLLLSLGAMWWALRGHRRWSARAMLAGLSEEGRVAIPTLRSRRRRRMVLAIGFAGLGLGLVAWSATLDVGRRPAGFFGGGAALLVASLAGLGAWMLNPNPRPIRPGTGALVRMGLRNAARRPRRSLLTAGLVMSAAFIIIAVGASRRHDSPDPGDRNSGTGGFALVGQTVLPVLGPPAVEGAVVMPFRVREGDDVSCLNLGRPRSPRLLGAGPAMIQRGGFSFGKSLASTPTERANPWLLLNRRFEDGAVPAIADASTATWLLKLDLGQDLVIRDEQDKPLHLRLVGLLSGSMLQSELVIAEDRLVQAFPRVGGYRFFLVEPPSAGGRNSPDQTAAVARQLRAELSAQGLDLEPAVERLARYHAVENAYIAAFAAIGGFGLVLGTLALGAVMARNVLERQGELALLIALGYRPGAIRLILLSESLGLLLAGLAGGTCCALVAITPTLFESPAKVNWATPAGTLALVLAAGTASTLLAVRAALRTSPLTALRRE